MRIKVIEYDGDSFETNVNGTIKEIVQYYFSMPDTKEIEFLFGGDFENDFYIKTPLKAYRVDEKEIEEYEFFYNVRVDFSVFHKDNNSTEIIKIGIVYVK